MAEPFTQNNKSGNDELQKKIFELVAAIPAFGIVIPGFLQILDKYIPCFAGQLFRLFIVIYFSVPAFLIILRILKIRLRNQFLIVGSYLVSVFIAIVIPTDCWNNWGIIIVALLELIAGTVFVYRYKDYTVRKYTVIFLFIISCVSTAIMLFPWKTPTIIEPEEKDPIGVFNSAVNTWNKIDTCQMYIDSSNARMNFKDSIEITKFRDRRAVLFNLWERAALSPSQINFDTMQAVIDTYPEFLLKYIKHDTTGYLVASIFSGIDGTMSEYNSLRESINAGKLSKGQIAKDSIRRKEIERLREIADGLITMQYMESQKRVLEKKLNYDTLRLAQLSYQKVFELGQKQIKLVIKDIRFVGVVIFFLTFIVLFSCKNNRGGEGGEIAETWMYILLLLALPLFKPIDEKNIDPTQPLFTSPNWYLPNYIASFGYQTLKQPNMQTTDLQLLTAQLNEIENELTNANTSIGNVKMVADSLSQKFRKIPKNP